MFNRGITVEEIAQKLKPLFGKKVDELYFRYSVASSMDEKNEIMQIFNSLYQKHLSGLLEKGILIAPPEEEDVKGEYPLGKVSYAHKQLFDFGLREKDWPRHMCVTGMSGSGKTNFAFQILKNFIKKDKPFLVFDWKKSFRPLLDVDKSLMCFTIGNDAVSNSFKTNINRPPKGVNPKEWIATLCDLMAESFSVSFGVHKILVETLDEAFEAWGIYDGSDHYPNWYHIKKLLESKSKEAKGRETGWYESALRVASVLTFGSFGKTVNYDGKKSLSIEDMFDKRAILELNSLSNIEKKFFAEFVLTYIFKLKKNSQNRVDAEFNYAILVDEAHNVFLKKDTNFLSESVTDMVYREMREYGTSLICLDQHVSKLSDTVTGNSACHVAFQQQLPQDIQGISSLMQMYENRDVFSQLPVGSAIVKLSDRHTRPFLLEAPLLDLRKDLVTDETIHTRMQFLIQQSQVADNDPDFLRAMQMTEDDSRTVGQSDSRNKEEEIEERQEEIVVSAPAVEPAAVEQLSKEEEAPQEEIMVSVPEVSVVKPEHIVYEINTPLTRTSGQSGLNERQQVLFEFAQEQIRAGSEISGIERMLERGIHEKQYTDIDVMKVINKTLELKLNGNICSRQKKDDACLSGSASVFSEFRLPKVESSIEVAKLLQMTEEQKLLTANRQPLTEEAQDEEEIINEEEQEERKPKPVKKEVGRDILKEERIEVQAIVSEEPKNVSEIKVEAPKALVEFNQNKKEVRTVAEEKEHMNKIIKLIRKDASVDVPEEVEIEKSSLDSMPSDLTADERKFMKFLIENSEHESSVTEIYKLVGLSARKGNVIKNKLMEKSLVRIEEERTTAGWKKYIRLA